MVANESEALIVACWGYCTIQQTIKLFAELASDLNNVRARGFSFTKNI